MAFGPAVKLLLQSGGFELLLLHLLHLWHGPMQPLLRRHDNMPLPPSSSVFPLSRPVAPRIEIDFGNLPMLNQQ